MSLLGDHISVPIQNFTPTELHNYLLLLKQNFLLHKGNRSLFGFSRALSKRDANILLAHVLFFQSFQTYRCNTVEV